jgi:hypothetical protein
MFAGSLRVATQRTRDPMPSTIVSINNGASIGLPI